MSYCIFFFFNHKTAYEMRISDCSSDVCSSDLEDGEHRRRTDRGKRERDEHLAAFQHAEFGEHFAAPGTREVGEREAKRRLGKKAPDRDDAERATPAERLADPRREIGRVNVWTPVTNAHHRRKQLLEKKNNIQPYIL